MKGWKERGREMGRDDGERKTAVRGTCGWGGGGCVNADRQTALGILVMLVCSLTLNAI